jgi:hypothetical protein
VPVIINEIEVLEQPPPPPHGAPAAPPPAGPAVHGEAILRLLRDAQDRQRRLVAD